MGEVKFKFLVCGKLKEMYADWESESILCDTYAGAKKTKSEMLKSGYFKETNY